MLEAWSLLAILAAACWSVVNVADKRLVTNNFPQYINYFLLESIAAFFIALSVFLRQDVNIFINFYVILFALASGVLEGFFALFYYRSLQLTDVSVVAVLLQAIPVFSVIGGVIVFGETLSIKSTVAICLIILASALASWERNNSKSVSLPKAFVLMMLAAVSVSGSYIFQVHALHTANTDTVFFLRHTGQLGFALLLLCLNKIRREFSSSIPNLSPYILVVILSLVALNLLGVYLQTLAFSLGNLSLVSVLSSMQPVFVLLAVIILNRISPKFIPDENTNRYVFVRAIAVIISIIGVVLLEV